VRIGATPVKRLRWRKVEAICGVLALTEILRVDDLYRARQSQRIGKHAGQPPHCLDTGFVIVGPQQDAATG